MEKKIINDIRNILKDDFHLHEASFSAESSFKNDFGLDSLDIVEITLKLEDKYHVNVSDEDAARIDTVQDMANAIINRL